jgi:signal transduction histidine kinase
MTNNAKFPSPTPALSAVTAAIVALQIAEAAAIARTKGAVTARNDRKAELVALLQQLVAGVVASESVRSLQATRAVVRTDDERRRAAAAAGTQDLVVIDGRLCAPMVTLSGCVGVLELELAQGRTLTAADRAFVLRLAQDGAFALERARQHDSERRARVEAEESNRAKDEFLGFVSHELRSPLTSILGWARMLRLCPAIDEEGREHALDVIERNARAQERLVTDLLDISRIAARKLRVDKRAVDVTEVVKTCVESLQQEAARREIALEVATPEPLTVLGDADRLRQVTTNLVWNALKFTRPGGHVSVDVELKDGSVLLRVRDDGMGIPAAELPFVFEAFRQGSVASGRRGDRGVGLGLAIVQSLVHEHGGSVRIESEGAGRGATATVSLPRLALESGLKRAS